MKIQISPSKAYGEIIVPPSKSISHRAIICAALSHGISHIYPIYKSDDVLATISCLNSFGINFNGNLLSNKNSGKKELSDLYVTGLLPQNFKNDEILNCNESASTLRFLIPLALISGKKFTFTGSNTLFSRSLKEYEDLCRNNNLLFSQNGNHLIIKGPLKPGTYIFHDNISSQFITGMLFALSLLLDDSRLIVPDNQVSKPYINLTISILSEFGISIVQNKNTFLIKGNQKYINRAFKIEGDYSNAAFFEALNFLGGDIKINGLNEYSMQGDRAFIDLLKILNLKNEETCKIDTLKIPEISLSDNPDLAPILFAVSAVKNGAVFTDINRLKLKESNRIESMRLELKKIGCNIIEKNRKIYVPKCNLIKPNEELFGHNDHRIVMALSVILTLIGGTIAGVEAVNKSYPTFFDDLESLKIPIRRIYES